LLGIKGSAIINNTTVKGILRLNDDGSIDTSFNNGAQGITSSSSGINVINIRPDGTIYIGGYGTLTYNGTARKGVLK